MQDRALMEEVLTRNGFTGATWIESGTYLGDTTEFLSCSAKMVYSIEPGDRLFLEAHKRFKRHANVRIINGLSENVLPELLPHIAGNVCFWLDGQYSDELTHKGPQDTPIVDELACIADNLARWSKVVVFIDDLHLFTGKQHVYGPYPHLDAVTAWAENHAMTWHTESDIFVCRNFQPTKNI
jgi:hypothetical protein